MITVLVTGPYTTGKTTLVSNLVRCISEKGISITKLDEPARNCPFPLNDRQTDVTSKWLILKQLTNELESSLAKSDVVLSDRGVIDIVAHALETEKRTGLRSKTLSELRETMLASVATYDLIFETEVNPSYPIIDDGTRSNDAEFQLYMAQFHKHAASLLNANTIILPDGLATRLRRVEKEINLLTGML